MVVLLVGMRALRNKAGCAMVGTSKLFGPPSITKMDSVESASASLPATTHPAVPPTNGLIIFGGNEIGRFTSSDDHIHLLDRIWECFVNFSHRGDLHDRGDARGIELVLVAPE